MCGVAVYSSWFNVSVESKFDVNFTVVWRQYVLRLMRSLPVLGNKKSGIGPSEEKV